MLPSVYCMKGNSGSGVYCISGLEIQQRTRDKNHCPHAAYISGDSEQSTDKI